MIRTMLTTMTGVALLGLSPWSANAQEPKAAQQPAKATAQSEKTNSDSPTPAQLRIEMHQTMAALIKAQAAEKPDQDMIDRLTGKLRTIRAQFWSQRPARADARRCPWGGPGMGYGRGWGGQGRGPGWSRGGGRGQGYGRGYGRGYARGWGFVDKDGDGLCDNDPNGPAW